MTSTPLLPFILSVLLSPKTNSQPQASSTEKNRQQLETFVNQLLFEPTFVKDNDVLRFFEIKPVSCDATEEVPEEVEAIPPKPSNSRVQTPTASAGVCARAGQHTQTQNITHCTANPTPM